jgi:hypothetical protein
VNKSKRSPLKDKPLRNPGESVDEQLQDRIYDELTAPLLIALVVLVTASIEWIRYAFSIPLSPWAYSFAALLTVGYAAFRISKSWPELKALRQGRDGEKAVGQFLERLREDGFQVFHDIVGPSFNIDHVVIGPAGVFTVETKTWSKPVRGEAKIRFDGKTLSPDGLKPDDAPVIQGMAQAGWLRGLLSESTGKKFSIRPMILFPGWFVEQSPGSTREIWVLNPKAVPTFLQNAEVVMTPEDVKLVSFHLSRYIREQQK